MNPEYSDHDTVLGRLFVSKKQKIVLEINTVDRKTVNVDVFVDIESRT